MTTCIALFRGINVGGRNRISMADLKNAIEQAGGRDVATYIQSGNAVFELEDGEPGEIGDEISRIIGDELGFEPDVLVLGGDEFRRAADRNPYPNVESDPKSLHLYFLDRRPDDPDLDELDELAAADERVTLDDQVIYLAAPSGIGRSKLAARLESTLGVRATGRNWATVSRLCAMLGDRQA